MSIFFLVLFAQTALSQSTVLTADKFGTNRKKWYAGDEINFKLKTAESKFAERILYLKDEEKQVITETIKFNLDELETLYYRRRYADFMIFNGSFVASGFLFAALVAPLVSNRRYDRTESFVIGTSFLTLSQSFRLARWKKYRNNERNRIQILNLNF